MRAFVLLSLKLCRRLIHRAMRLCSVTEEALVVSKLLDRRFRLISLSVCLSNCVTPQHGKPMFTLWFMTWCLNLSAIKTCATAVSVTGMLEIAQELHWKRSEKVVILSSYVDCSARVVVLCCCWGMRHFLTTAHQRLVINSCCTLKHICMAYFNSRTWYQNPLFRVRI